MALTLDGTAGITFPSGSGTQAAQSKVLQVINSTSGSSFSTSSGSFVTTGISASITPLFSTSKILVMFSAFNMVQTGNMAPVLTVYRGATALDSVGFSQSYSSIGVTSTGTGAGVYLDSPATTSSTAYTLYFRNQNNNGSVTLNSSNGLVSIVLMEIVA
jgi:hypothetical protein